jgi:hypothetical protein
MSSAVNASPNPLINNAWPKAETVSTFSLPFFIIF